MSDRNRLGVYHFHNDSAEHDDFEDITVIAWNTRQAWRTAVKYMEGTDYYYDFADREQWKVERFYLQNMHKPKVVGCGILYG